MLRIIKFVLATSVFVAAISACGGQSADTDGSRTYLQEVKPACVPLEGAINDPCARRLPWSVFSYPDVSASFSEDRIKRSPINVEEEMRRVWKSGGLFTPQIIVRGTVLPGSARCVDDGALILADEYHYMATPEDPLEVCYIDVSVSEYIVGQGPGRVTVVAGWRLHVDPGYENYGTQGYYDQLAEPIRRTTEGIEFIFELVSPVNIAHGEWYKYNLWDVQRKSDGSLVGVSWWLGYLGTPDTIGNFEHPLSELQSMLKAAHAKVAAEFGGRISDEPDSPMLVTDASRDNLLAQLREVGAYDAPGITPVPAPPAPIPPVEPGELTALPLDNAGGIPLSWDAPDSGLVSGYKVVRRVPKGDFVTVVADTGTTETTYTDTSAPMTAGVTYIYRVLALNEYGESLASNRATVELPGPLAPTDFTAAYSDGDVVLTWSQPGVIMPSCYRIYRRAQGEQSFEWVVNCWSAELRSWRDDDVVSGTRYIYRIVPMIGYTESGATARASVRVR